MFDEFDFGDLLVEHGNQSLSLLPEFVEGVLLLLLYEDRLPTSRSRLVSLVGSSLGSLLFVELEIAFLLVVSELSIVLVVDT